MKKYVIIIINHSKKIKETKRIQKDNVIDVSLTQTWLQSQYGLYNLVIKNSSHFGDFRTSDLEVNGVENGNELVKAILSHR